MRFLLNKGTHFLEGHNAQSFFRPSPWTSIISKLKFYDRHSHSPYTERKLATKQQAGAAGDGTPGN